MAIVWDEARIAALPSPEVKQLRENAAKKPHQAIVDLCTAEIEKRGLNVAPKTRRASAASDDPLRLLEKELASQLGSFGAELTKAFDLTPETASNLSVGVKGFRAHALVQKDGTAKLGGSQRSGFSRIDRYISYRTGNRIVSVGAYLAKDAAIDDVQYHVFAPNELLADGESVETLRPTHKGEKVSPLSNWGKAFATFDAAKARFTAILSEMAPARS
jgi:hypothetical protein